MKFVTALEIVIKLFVCGSECSVDDEEVMHLVSVALSENCEKDFVDDTAELKSVFLDVDVDPVKPVANHTHGASAACRSTASRLIERVSQAAGKTPVFYQGSRADVRNGRVITRSYHWAKDFMAPNAPPITNPDLVAMVDVDYYVNMEKKLVKDFVPHILYTFQPTSVCKDDGEYKYTFQHDDIVNYTVSGGGAYEHQVWNWDGDSLSVSKKSYFGLTKRYSTYAIERRRMDDDHQVILLSPLRSYKGFWISFLAKKFARAKQLERLKVVDGEFLRMSTNTESGIYVCTGKVGGYCQARVRARVDDAIASAVVTTSQKITLATVKSKMADNKPGDMVNHVGAEILLEYHRTTSPKPGNIISIMENGVRRFQWIRPGALVDEDTKPGMVAFMNPLYNNGFVPDNCLGNEARAVTERVEKLKSIDLVIPAFVDKCMDEFITLLLGNNENCLVPVEIEEVYARQPRPTQRHILDAAQHEAPTDVTKQFVKREAYPNVNDPRLISTINGNDKMHYSAYIYAFTEIIKSQPWYAFSKTPLEIAQRVAEVCSRSEWVDLTDFSRMDGRIGNVARCFERKLMLRAFDTRYHPHLAVLMRKQYCLRAVTTHGIRYDQGLARASGSAETSAFNTVLNAFVCFMGYRRTQDRGSFIQPKEAYASLGIYGGDDGLSGGLAKVGAEKAAQSVGQKLELVRVYRGQLGVSFLARHYGPDVWFEDLNSCCDIRRQLSKFHLTVALPSNITAQVKLQEKAFAFSLSDCETPIIGTFASKVLKLFPMKAHEFRNNIQKWNVITEMSVQYPNIAADWMDDIVARDLPEFDMEAFYMWIAEADSSTIFLPPVLAPTPDPVMKEGICVVDEDLVVKATPPPPAPSTPPPKHRGRKKKGDRPSHKPKSREFRARKT